MTDRIEVNEVMTRGIISIKEDSLVEDAMKKMLDRRVTSLIVETGGVDGYGIITRKDIVTKVIAEDKDPGKVGVKDIMSEPLQTVSPDEDIKHVAGLMAESGIRRFPVMKDGRLIGMISNGDIVKAETIHLLPETQRHTISNLKERFSSISAQK
ncbi:MAG: CBS domain-containing protein [Candidatus Altiarchaeota archaeon]|nr:CBS domain-containing protein [Candidatus Altiarchaeota archaeon]